MTHLLKIKTAESDMWEYDQALFWAGLSMWLKHHHNRIFLCSNFRTPWHWAHILITLLHLSLESCWEIHL